MQTEALDAVADAIVFCLFGSKLSLMQIAIDEGHDERAKINFFHIFQNLRIFYAKKLHFQRFSQKKYHRAKN
jgi:hypothetical protein